MMFKGDAEILPSQPLLWSKLQKRILFSGLFNNSQQSEKNVKIRTSYTLSLAEHCKHEFADGRSHDSFGLLLSPIDKGNIKVE